MVRAITLFWLLSLLSVGVAPGLADGMMVRPLTKREWARNRERAMINEPNQKAVVFFEKGRQQLIISPSFDGAPAEFAWIIPVPSRPNVQILDGAIFHELARLTSPPPPRQGNGFKGAAGSAPTASVQVLERKTVGAYDVSVLAATDGRALSRWLNQNGYRVPERAQKPISEYVREKWTFVACKVKNTGSASGLRSGTLAPIRLTFNTKRPVYPMRISSTNPGYFHVLVYLILPRTESGGERNGRRLTVSAPGNPAYINIRWAAEFLPHNRRPHPTVAKLSRAHLDIFVLQSSFQPQDSTRDYVWQTRGSMSAAAIR